MRFNNHYVNLNRRIGVKGGCTGAVNLDFVNGQINLPVLTLTFGAPYLSGVAHADYAVIYPTLNGATGIDCSFSTLKVISDPTLTFFNGSIDLNQTPLLVTISLPKLATLAGVLTVNQSNLAVLSLPRLTNLAGLTLGHLNLTTLNLPVLTEINGDFLYDTVGGILILNFDHLTTLSGNLTTTNSGPLTTLTANLITDVGQVSLLNSGALATVSFNSLLTCQGIIVQFFSGMATINCPVMTLDVGDFIVDSSNITTLNFPNLASAVNISLTSWTYNSAVLSFPSLTNITSFNLVGMGGAITTLSLAVLFIVGGDFTVSNHSLTTLLVNSLKVVAGGIIIQNHGFTTLSFPNLTVVGTIIGITNGSALTDVNLPLISGIATIIINNNASLININAPGMFSTAAFQDYSGNALPQSEVDGIINECVTGGLIGGELHLDGGTNSAPSAAGLAAVAILVGNGWTVTTN